MKTYQKVLNVLIPVAFLVVAIIGETDWRSAIGGLMFLGVIGGYAYKWFNKE